MMPISCGLFRVQPPQLARAREREQIWIPWYPNPLTPQLARARERELVESHFGT
jgi:hypothetical protein